jgi:hypothetical protein
MSETQVFCVDHPEQDWRIALEQSRVWITEQLSLVIDKTGTAYETDDLQVENESDDDSATSPKRMK